MSRHIVMSNQARISVDRDESRGHLRVTSSIGGSGLIISVPSREKAQELIDALLQAREEMWPR